MYSGFVKLRAIVLNGMLAAGMLVGNLERGAPVAFAACSLDRLPRINLPYFTGEIPFEQMAIAWFGRVSSTTNYTDIRAAYNGEELYLYFAVFDRSLWYLPSLTVRQLQQADAVTVFLQTNDSSTLSAEAWQFTAQLHLYEEEEASHKAAYRWQSGQWQMADILFRAIPGWRGDSLNNNGGDRGWAMGLHIPFASLGLQAPPHDARWRMAVVVHDKDTAVSAARTGGQQWPRPFTTTSAQCWGILHFGLPVYQPVGTPSGSTTIVRPSQKSSLVPDADVGGASANQCPGNERFIWNQWGNRNYGKSPDFNIQNQSDVADWPCFSKYYIAFPLTSIPRGKAILSAQLILHQFGNAGGEGAQSSWIQTLTTLGNWSERGITWNNAPLAHENIGGAWVPPIADGEWPGWPGIPRVWDVTYAVAQAYAANQPLRLILYEADSAYHSGKYFVSSDTGDWNAAGRPQLVVTWGEP